VDSFDVSINIVRRTEAARIVQAAFEACFNAGVKWVPSDPRLLGVELVGAVWRKSPNFFDGRGTAPPHRLAIAAYALAQGMQSYRLDTRMTCAMGVALGIVLQHLVKHFGTGTLNSTEALLVEHASNAYFEHDDDTLELISLIERLLRKR
jgi:hypothetical protein